MSYVTPTCEVSLNSGEPLSNEEQLPAQIGHSKTDLDLRPKNEWSLWQLYGGSELEPPKLGGDLGAPKGKLGHVGCLSTRQETLSTWADSQPHRIILRRTYDLSDRSFLGHFWSISGNRKCYRHAVFAGTSAPQNPP
ncbi:hypothetical protein CRENBAI_020666 [Crenichthys baileyi]|uniref:Uncharacterized protein n=1 Tax=Crenichthys baileyi TaxID=28760 RepID=A0AAV9RZN0_9TELE